MSIVSSDVIAEITPDALSLVEIPDFVAPFSTRDKAGDTAIQEGTAGKHNIVKM